ncbi:MAG: Matrixin family protein [Candidatus Nomurabacteria bacterium GW2011_GWA2_40_9]|uniref:Matrixin family protein n=1 Tax=Candidatus Nomurabacteria bacterium GW2011_GWA2_40_9 TaxID=1618734 RepID=A0A0G0TNA1_9BACT|nr:MAG: Matrixin family protein [Candidatus Nomurabacteria bacterium GW2011_GWA2_40_9]
MVKNLFKNILALALLATVFFVFRPQIENSFQQLKNKYLPCREPIAYSLAQFDTEFGLSKEEFLKMVIEAEAIWETPTNKNLFEYREDGDLKINLVYDDRQQVTIKLQKADSIIDDSRSSYTELKAKYDILQREYNQLKNNKAEVSELNHKAEEINALVVVLNKMVMTLNLNVQQFNKIGADYTEEFEEGLYKSSIEGTSIDIYQYDSRTKLVRVLAHELGHALGLEHIEDTQAIMYKLNNSTSKKLTESDLIEVNKLCGDK